MNWKKAVQESNNNTAVRVEISGNIRKHYVRYSDGTCHVLKNNVDTGKMINTQPFFVEAKDADKFTDWKPSE